MIGLAVVATSIPLLLYAFSFSRHDSGWAGSQSRVTARSPLPVSTFILGEIEPPPQLDAYRGLVVPSKEAELGFRRGGRIASLLVEEGSRVRQGDCLAILDSSDVLARLSMIRSQITEAEAVLEELIAGPRKQTIEAARSEVARLDAVLALSQVTFDRESSLLRSKATSDQQFDEARFAVQQSRAALESAKQRLSELIEGTRPEQLAAQRARKGVLSGELTNLEVDLSDVQIVAPFDGVIAKRYVDEGTMTGPQSKVVRLIQCNPLEAYFGIAPNDARTLHVGSIVRVTVGEKTLQASVVRIEPELDSASRTQGLFARLPDGCELNVVPGETASLAMIGLRDPNAMWVPNGALSRAGRGLWSVIMVDDSGVTRRREVQVVDTDTRLARIVGTMLQPGDRLIASGIHRITPGMKVEIGKAQQ